MNGKKEEVDRRRRRKTVLGGQGLTFAAQPEQLMTEQDVKRLLRGHLWCPNNLSRYGID